ncbi:MAG: hypothetical protein ABW221_14725 [Vicinamibacteria bacterium]
MFGKPVREYLALQKWWLLALAILGLLRIGLSIGGPAFPSVKWWTSTNLLGYAAAVYYGVAGYRRGYLFKQLYPLALFHMILFHALAILGILLTIAGYPNLYATPEVMGSLNQWWHIGAHLTLGMAFAPLIGWGLASLAMLVTRAVAPRPAAVAS